MFVALKKLEKNHMPPYLSLNLQRNYNAHHYHTRRSKHFYTKSAETRWGQRTVLNQGLSMYNKLPRDLRSCETVGEFRENFFFFFFFVFVVG